MVSVEVHDLTVRSILSVNQVLSVEVFETKYQKVCVWVVVWVEIE
jgi:hypothetical protein